MGIMSDFIFLGSKINVDGDCNHKIKRHSLLGRTAMTNLDNIFKTRDITLLTKVQIVKTIVFPVVMNGCESWTIKKAKRQRTDTLKLWCWRRPESPLDCKKIKPVNPKGNQSWIFTEKSDAKSEAPILWPRDVKSWLTGKDSDAGKNWGQEEKRVKEDEMVGWQYWLNRHEFEQTQGDSKAQKAWCAAIHGVAKSWTGLKWQTEKQGQLE